MPTSLEYIVLNSPARAGFLQFDTSSDPESMDMSRRVRQLIRTFDCKPFVGTCSSADCGKPPTRVLSPGQGRWMPTLWCDACQPKAGNKYEVIRGYGEGFRFVDGNFLKDRKKWWRTVAHELAQMKGLPKDYTQEDLREFFR